MRIGELEAEVKSDLAARPGGMPHRAKVNGLKEVYSPTLLEPTPFVMVSNNKKVCTISECYVASII